MTTPRVLFALIHNGDEGRLAAIRPPLTEGARQLRAEVHEFHWQPDPDASGVSLLSRLLANRIDERRHRRHLRFRGSGRPAPTLGAALRATAGALLRRGATDPFQSAIIERLLTDKHIRAWTALLDSEAQAVIVLEDDAVLTSAGFSRLKDLIESDRIELSTHVYLDLAGGYPIMKLCRPDAVRRLDQDLLETPAFGNTTCGYLVSRPLAALMVAELTWHPTLRRMGPDWLVNELLMRIHRTSPVRCLHAEPSVFGHGSFLGVHASLISPRPAPRDTGV